MTNSDGSEVKTSGPRKRRLLFRNDGERETEPTTRDPVRDLDPGSLEIGRVYRRNRYLSSQVSLLVARYVRIRGDLLQLAVAEDILDDAKKNSNAKRCADHLTTAKSQLESRHPNLAVCSSALSLADRQLVTLYPGQTLVVRFEIVRQLLLDRADKSEKVKRELHVLGKFSPTQEAAGRTRLQEGLITAYQIDEQELLEDDLQVTRLRRLLTYMLVSWIVLMLAMPFVTIGVLENRRIANWPVYVFQGSAWLTQMVAALGISIIGAVGGIISGMFGVRDARATLGDFRTSLLRLSLKPVAGAIAALIVYLFLSWQVISGVSVTSGGVYVLAAFLAGFSERYFLRMLRTEETQGLPAAPDRVGGQQNGRVISARSSANRGRRPAGSSQMGQQLANQPGMVVTPEPLEPPPSGA